MGSLESDYFTASIIRTVNLAKESSTILETTIGTTQQDFVVIFIVLTHSFFVCLA
jgi:hypothetical protein